MKFDEQVLRSCCLAGFVSGLIGTLLYFALSFVVGVQLAVLKLPLGFDSAVWLFIPFVVFLLAGSLISGFFSFFFGLLYVYIPGKSVFGKYSVFSLLVSLPLILLAVFLNLPAFIPGFFGKLLFNLVFLIIDILLFSYFYSKFFKGKRVVVSLNFASLKRRFAACLVDVLLLVGFSIISFIIIVLPNLSGLHLVSDSSELTKSLSVLLGPWSVVIFVGWFLYWPVLEFFFKKTIGKLILGLEVVREDGKPIGLFESVVRNLPKMFGTQGIVLLFFDLVPALKLNAKQRFLDLVAGTIVVKTKK